MAVQKISLRKKGSSFALGDTLYPMTHWSYIEGKPSTFTPTAHTHSEYLLTTAKAADSNLLDGLDSSHFLRSNATSGFDRIFQNGTGIPTNNLGSPSISEMALFQEQFNNKTEFYDISKIKFYTSTDGSTWVEYTGISDSAKRLFVGGDTSTNVSIPNGTPHFRIEIEAVSYVYLNALYIYWTSSSHSTKVKMQKKRCDNQTWYQHTNSENTVSSWPGHMYMPFSTIPFHPSGTSHFDAIRIDFEPVWSGHATYGTYPIHLHRLQLWGGYPAGRRTIYSVNEYKDVNFPGQIKENGQRVYSPNNIPSLATLGAAPEHTHPYLPDNHPIASASAGDISSWVNTAIDYAAHASASNPHGITPALIGAYTQAQVDAKVASLVDSSPETLNTLDELAAALGDDPNFATTIANEIGTKVTKNADITAGTKTKITYDSKGLVTDGANLEEADIPSLNPSKIEQNISNRFVSDLEKTAWNAKQNAVSAGTSDQITIGTDTNVKLWAPNILKSAIQSLSDLDTNNYLTGVSGSGDGTVTFTRQGLSNLTWDASHTHSEYLLTTGKATDSEKLDNLDSTQFLRSDSHDTFSGQLSVPTTSRSAGIYGNYDSTKIGHVWSMGTAYAIPNDGSNFGSLYGIAYKHTNNITGGNMAGGHQIVFTNAGTPGAAIGMNGNVWTKGIFQSTIATGTAPLSVASTTLVTNLNADMVDGVHSSSIFHTGHKPQFSEVEGSVAHGQLPYATSTTKGAIRVTVSGDSVTIHTG